MWVEAKKGEIAVQQYWKESRNKASVDQRQSCQSVGDSGVALVSGEVHRIGMVACFISEICKWAVSCPKTDRFRLVSKALHEKTENLPAWETYT